MEIAEIILKPRINQGVRGLDDDYNSNTLLFEQGYDMDYMEVSAGEEFEIEEHIESGYLNCEGEMMKLIYNDEYEFIPDFESDEQIIFEKGKYLFHEDGVTF